MLAAGTPAPDFELPSGLDKKQKLSDLRGQRVVLAFYPNDWSPVCSGQMALYSQALPLFAKHNAAVLGLSVDSRFCHQAFADNRHLHFPLLADFEPKGAVAKLFDVYDEAGGTSQRALFVLDEQGVVRWSYVSPNDVNPGADGILEALEKLDESAKKS